jgi:DNA-binding transcriptional LysR family regulator
VAQATSAGRLRVLATAGCAEHVAGAVLAAFTRRLPRAAVDLTVGSTECAAGSLADDVADIVLGVRPVPAAGQALDAVPFLRYERVVVAASGHPLAGGGPVRTADLVGCRWLAGPAGIEAGSEEARWADLLPVPPDVDRLGSEAEALSAVRGGGGLMLALAHAVRDDVRKGSVVRLPVEGTPVTGLWWAGVPGDGAATSAARALQRFLTTPDATSALLGGPTLRDRARPTVRVELWS